MTSLTINTGTDEVIKQPLEQSFINGPLVATRCGLLVLS